MSTFASHRLKRTNRSSVTLAAGSIVALSTFCGALQAQQSHTVVRDYVTGQINNSIEVGVGKPITNEVLTIYSLQSHQTGRVSNVGAEAFTYQVVDAEPLTYSVFLNFNASTGLLFPGTMLGDNCGLDNGFTPGVDEISSYDAKLFRSSLDPQPGLADFHMELWDGDPFASFDTPGLGFTNTVIAGTEADIVDIPAATQFIATALLPKGITAPNATVWMIVSGSETGVNPSPCRLGWDIAYQNPNIGNVSPSGDLMIAQSDDSGVGVCCEDASPCDVPGGVPCTGDIGTCNDGTDGCRGFCQDGDAEAPAGFTIGGPQCTAHAGLGNCSNFTASISSPATSTFTLAQAGTGNTAITAQGGDQLELEILAGNWDPNGIGTRLLAWEADIDGYGYTTGFQGYLTPTLIPCTTDDDCNAAFGGVCNITGGACTVNADCPLAPIENCAGSQCNASYSYDGYCAPGFIYTGKSNYIFSTAGGDLASVDLNPAYYRYASADPTGVGVAPPSPFEPQYCGTLRLNTSSDCKGTFTVGFLPTPASVMVDPFNRFIPMLGFVPAEITCPIGRCCSDLAGAGECWDNVTEEQCHTLGTPPLFWDTDPNATCAEPCCECIDDSACQDGLWCNGTERCINCRCELGTPPDCGDTAACTTDSCVEDGQPWPLDAGHCENVPDHALCNDGLWCNGIDVCDPAVGCRAEPAPCDDSIGCTDDTCNELNRTCTNTPNDAICDDGLWCNGVESCDAALDCQWGTEPCGTTPCDEDNDQCEPTVTIPTVSQWGLIGLSLLLLIGAKVYFKRRTPAH